MAIDFFKIKFSRFVTCVWQIKFGDEQRIGNGISVSELNARIFLFDSIFSAKNFLMRYYKRAKKKKKKVWRKSGE